jgi:1,2-phenylacetyl-CoA epoxidase PaaB subunit
MALQAHPITTEVVMLSETRRNIPMTTGDLTTSEVENFPIWEVFTQKKENDVHVHAGSLSSPDASFAQLFAREHYGQDQVCISLWVGPRELFTSDEGENEIYEVFVQWSAGLKHEHVGEVEAGNGKEAKDICKEQFVGEKTFFSIWAIQNSKLTKVDGATDMIWRATTDQTYRLASGYSRKVRQKWDALRASNAVDKYQEEDLKETY